MLEGLEKLPLIKYPKISQYKNKSKRSVIIYLDRCSSFVYENTLEIKLLWNKSIQKGINGWWYILLHILVMFLHTCLELPKIFEKENFAYLGKIIQRKKYIIFIFIWFDLCLLHI